MVLTDQQRIELDVHCRPLLKFLCDNFHPHVSVIVTPTSFELLEGSYSSGVIMDYVQD